MKLKGETGIMRKKFTSLQKEIDDHKEEIKKYQAETTKLNTVIRNLEKDIAGLKKEIQERDETIQDKVNKTWITNKDVKWIVNLSIKSSISMKRTLIIIQFTYRKRGSTTWKRRIKSWKNSNLSWITRSKSLRNRSSLEKTIIKAMKEQIQEVGAHHPVSHCQNISVPIELSII